jgi:small-conductance mechanosensitive channel
MENVGGTEIWLAAAVFVGTVLTALILRRLLVRVVDRGDADRSAGRLAGRSLSVLVVALGFVYALSILGVSIGPLVGALGVGGIALAFALQDILQNFVAGVLIQIRRPFRVRDQISSGDFEGTVIDVNLRTTELSTYDGLIVYLPNADVLKTPIVNFTRTPSSRTSLTVGLAYDTDLTRAVDVLITACGFAEGVLENPPPEVWVEEFGDSSINLAVRYWHAADIASRWRVRSAVAVSIKAALDEAGMVIPFPQRTLWFGPGSTTLGVTQLGAGEQP